VTTCDPDLSEALERIEALERRLAIARAMAQDLAAWIDKDVRAILRWLRRRLKRRVRSKKR